MKLYGFPKSSCTQRVLLAADELGIKLDYVEVDLYKSEHKAPNFPQPFGMVPYLELDDGSVMYESRAIALYLARRTNNNVTHALFADPSDIKAAACLDQGLSVELSNWESWTVSVVVEGIIRTWQGEQPNHDLVEHYCKRGEKALDGYEHLLSQHKYITGNHLSFADLSHLPLGHFVFNVAGHQHLLDSRPHVKAWWEELQTRPSWKRVEAWGWD